MNGAGFRNSTTLEIFENSNTYIMAARQRNRACHLRVIAYYLPLNSAAFLFEKLKRKRYDKKTLMTKK